MRKITVEEIAQYIIDAPFNMYEDGCYYAHYNSENGLNYEGNANLENLTAVSSCYYSKDIDTLEEFYKKENLDDYDFMKICEELAEQLNAMIEEE